MQKRWIPKPYSQEVADRLQKELKIHPVLCRLLAQRGISTYEEAYRFFRPKMDELHDPFLMKDMDKAVERIISAIEKEEKIMIYGDYDVDGTTSVALMYSFLEELHPHLEFYIPDRYAEGYGISFKGIDTAIEAGCSLMIALDCGIKAVDKVAYANELGLDSIICDHHRPGDELPQAIAILDPKQIECSYPYKELSGCGIGFKLIQALAHKLDIPSELVFKHLDLVVVSIGSDIVPITGENRILAHYGLKAINSNPRKGIRSLLKVANIKKKLSVTDIVFVLGPRINAAGRMMDGKNAVKLLMSNDDKVTLEKALLLHENNRERKEIDKSITKEALQLIEEDKKHKSQFTTIVFDPRWHKGVIGIVASRLIETHHRPTIVFTESNGRLTGSARSVRGFDLYKAIEQCADLLENFGGHTYAAGLTIKRGNLEAFKTKFEKIVAEKIDPEHLVQEIAIDAELNFDQINDKFFRILEQFAPFGPDNLRPVFITKNAKATGQTRIVGDDHLKLVAKQGNKEVKGIAFNMGNHLKHIQNNEFDVCYSIDENVWNGYVNLELYIKDIKTTTQ